MDQVPTFRTAIRMHITRRGFTLIEIVASLAILGILMAIAIPPIYRSMDSAGSRQDTDALAGRLRLARSQALSSYSDVIVMRHPVAGSTATGRGRWIPRYRARRP